jgi:hypothetical protein
MPKARLLREASTTSGTSRRSASDVVQEDRRPVFLKGKRSISIFAIGTRIEGINMRTKSIFAFGSRSVLHLDLAHEAAESWWERKRKNGSSAVHVLPAHRHRRVITNARKSSFAEESGHQPRSRHESQLLRQHQRHLHLHQSQSSDHRSFRKSSTTIATSTMA